MGIDWTITFGNILTIIGFFVAAAAMFVNSYYQLQSVQSGVSNINTRMDKIDEELKKQTDILVNQARQTERINALERRIDDLYDRLHPKALAVPTAIQPL